jgi:predicted RND superfamily exporter protein
MPPDSPRGRTFGNYLLTQRQPIGWLLVAITVFLSYWAVRVPIATRFEDLFPSNHPNTVLYRKHKLQYGRALTLALLLRVDQGDIFNFKTLKTIQDINNAVDILPGVNHNEVYSLASYRVFYSKATPGTVTISPYMHPRVPANQAQLTALEDNVREHQGQLAGVVTGDLKGALIIASFTEGDLDYKTLFDQIQEIVRKYQDSNTHIYAGGPIMFYGWGYHYLPLLTKIFAASFALIVLLTLFALGARTGWWAPILTGVASAIWGLGFMSLRGYNFDPIMLVIPLILTARNLAHGIQWQGRYYREVDQADDKILACMRTADEMLRPGLYAVLINIAGVAFIALSDVPVLRQIGLSGAVWLGVSIVLVFVGQPILVSYLPRPRPLGHAGATAKAFAGIPLSGSFAQALLIGAGLGAVVLGSYSYRHVLVGYQTAGTPLYRSDAEVNRETAEISRYVPTNTAWVIVDTPEYPDPQSGYGTKTIRVLDDMADYLLSRGDVTAVIDLGGLVEKPMNQLFHNSAPKLFAVPDTEQLSVSLFFFFVQGAAPDQVTAYFENLLSAKNSCVRLLLPDHTSARLARIRRDLDTFVRERVSTDPQLKDIKLQYLGGDAGLYQAADDVMNQINARNLLLVLTAVLILGAIAFRSIVAGSLLVVVALMGNLIAFTFMNQLGMGLTVDTVPVISLGVGLGLSFAIYALFAIRAEMAGGVTLNEAIHAGLSRSGATIVGTYLLMVAALVPWVFSPVLFQNEMSALLILLMTTNLIAGFLILPALLVLKRPHFLIRYERDLTASAKRVATQGVS